MNVTDRGYYTSQYLENVNRRGHRQYDGDERPRFKKAPASEAPRTSQAPKTSGTVPSRSAGADAVPVPAAPGDSSGGFTVSPESQATAELTDPVDPLEYDPDELQQELTPAQLNVLQKQHAKPRRHRQRAYYDDDSYYDDDRHSDIYDNYYNRDRQLHQVPRQYKKKAPKLQKPKGDNYYIQQKKLYDEAEFVKPTIYTHRTFKDVFKDTNEDDKKFNPMVYVFDDSENKELDQKEKLKNAFKSLQVKLGKDDYQNYDYYDKKDTKINAVNEIFVHGDDSESESEGGIAANREVFRSDAEAQLSKKKGKFKNLWRKKVKKAKKELGMNYKKNLEKQWDMEDDIKRQRDLVALTKHEEEEEAISEVNEPIIAEPDDESQRQAAFYGGPNPQFHPLWNYVLSWLVYEKAPMSHPAPGQQAVDITGSKKPTVFSRPDKANQIARQKTPPTNGENKRKIRVTAAQLKDFNRNLVKNYKGLKSKWNMPAADFFNNGLDADTINQPLPHSVWDIHTADDNSQEFIIELDEDVSSVDEELYYNPHTKQLQKEPPTSLSSMDEADRRLAMGMSAFVSKSSNRALIAANQSAKGIVSNINSLLKSVRLLKIIFAPIDIIAESFPNLQTVVIMIELIIFMWMLYELSLLIDALCMMVKAVCAPMIAMGRFMNRIM